MRQICACSHELQLSHTPHIVKSVPFRYSKCEDARLFQCHHVVLVPIKSVKIYYSVNWFLVPKWKHRPLWYITVHSEIILKTNTRILHFGPSTELALVISTELTSSLTITWCGTQHIVRSGEAVESWQRWTTRASSLSHQSTKWVSFLSFSFESYLKL